MNCLKQYINDLSHSNDLLVIGMHIVHLFSELGLLETALGIQPTSHSARPSSKIDCKLSDEPCPAVALTYAGRATFSQQVRLPLGQRP